MTDVCLYSTPIKGCKLLYMNSSNDWRLTTHSYWQKLDRCRLFVLWLPVGDMAKKAKLRDIYGNLILKNPSFNKTHLLLNDMMVCDDGSQEGKSLGVLWNVILETGILVLCCYSCITLTLIILGCVVTLRGSILPPIDHYKEKNTNFYFSYFFIWW